MAKILKPGKKYLSASQAEFPNAYLVIDWFSTNKEQNKCYSSFNVLIYKDKATRELAKSSPSIEPLYSTTHHVNELLESFADCYNEIKNVIHQEMREVTVEELVIDEEATEAAKQDARQAEIDA